MTSIPPSLYTSQSASSLSVHSAADTVTSTAPLTAAYRPPPKDYAAAFANLQGQYGMSGDFPVHASMPSKKKARKQAPSRSRSLSGPSNPTPADSRATNPSSRSIVDTPKLPIATRRTSSEPGRVWAPVEPPSAIPPAAVDGNAVVEGTEGGKEKTSRVSKLKKMLRIGRKDNNVLVVDPDVDLFMKVDDRRAPITASLPFATYRSHVPRRYSLAQWLYS
ncbi:hypothetical protein DFH06DRAFT_1318676 [Mycena polygramma]|nr:hypothetical protein DFH06DRAFT_1318676 [Mycena polygramma]